MIDTTIIIYQSIELSSLYKTLYLVFLSILPTHAVKKCKKRRWNIGDFLACSHALKKSHLTRVHAIETTHRLYGVRFNQLLT